VSAALLLLVLAFAAEDEPPADQAAPRLARADITASIDRGVAFLLRTQNEDGSWGSWQKPIDTTWSNIGTHKAWIAATTAIVCSTLMEVDEERSARVKSALIQGLEYLLNQQCASRPSGWDVDNTWALVYTLDTMARAVNHPLVKGTSRAARLRTRIEETLKKLEAYQTPGGGWGYYDDPPYTLRPKWGTSFMTAAVLLGMTEAKEAGIEVNDKTCIRAVRALKRCRLPSGAYTYSVEAVPSPGALDNIDQVKGSLSRIQVGNLALFRAGEAVKREDLRKGLDLFFRNHRFLRVARGRPIPHESFYFNSGYFFFFGHYYAAGVIEELEKSDQEKYWPLLQAAVLATQEKDGSMWDFYLAGYHRAYGTGWGVSALIRSLRR